MLVAAHAVGRRVVAAGDGRRVVGEARARGHVLAHLLDERLQLVHDLLEGLGGVRALLLLLLEEGVDRGEVVAHRRHQPRVVARAQLVAQRIDLRRGEAAVGASRGGAAAAEVHGQRAMIR